MRPGGWICSFVTRQGKNEPLGAAWTGAYPFNVP